MLIDTEQPHPDVVDVRQREHGRVDDILHRPPRHLERGSDLVNSPTRPDHRVQDRSRSRVKTRARKGSWSLTWTNVRRAHSGSTHSHRGLRTTTSTTPPPCPCPVPPTGTSLTRCRVQACTRVETTPQSGQPSSRSLAWTTTRRPPLGRSTASITVYPGRLKIRLAASRAGADCGHVGSLKARVLLGWCFSNTHHQQGHEPPCGTTRPRSTTKSPSSSARLHSPTMPSPPVAHHASSPASASSSAKL